MVIPSNRGSGRLRARQVERILSGEEPRDSTGAFLAAMVQDLRDVSRAEVPSGVAARHLLKMRLATEMGEGGPGPLPELDEPELPPVRPLERRRPAVAALGLAAAMVMMVGIAASISGPRSAGTRAGSIITSEVPDRSTGDRAGGFERFITNNPPTTDVGCGTTRLSALAVSLTGEVAPVLSQWPAVCPSSSGPVQPNVQSNGGAVVDRSLSTVVAGALDGGSSGSRTGVQVGGGGGSGGGDAGSGTDGGSGNNPGPGGDSGGGQDPVGGGTGGTTDPGATAKGNANGHDKNRGKGGDGPGASDHKEKGSGKKAGH